ncbi:hypothetical protein TRFO_41411 [Tritrichomonas foetus]|uniref:Uncharacterized protein n=1 Tax=Tritrichomonas foetus TaxID=1144522 RepID=A0A1J4L4W2_9EUKA|nr:hypothetical protein TRFO_41411 [Tritrichomonas foetus]|eukprot:OHT16974.1 hypothetical protein TRFO_41411 [Tritrichomonas foetus]
MQVLPLDTQALQRYGLVYQEGQRYKNQRQKLRFFDQRSGKMIFKSVRQIRQLLDSGRLKPYLSQEERETERETANQTSSQSDQSIQDLQADSTKVAEFKR